MRCVRIRFKKTGMIRYISHLDLMRAMTRLVRRSRIPLWYTEGFNPHPYMTFALPLSLGMESECESMDIKIEGEITNDEILRLLTLEAPEGIEFTAVTEPLIDPKFIAFGDFDISFQGVSDIRAFCDMIVSMLGSSELIVQKTGKKGRKKVEKDVNLIEFIKSYSLDTTDETVTLNVILPAGSAKNVNPSLLADSIVKRAPNAIYGIKRKRLLTNEMVEF